MSSLASDLSYRRMKRLKDGSDAGSIPASSTTGGLIGFDGLDDWKWTAREATDVIGAKPTPANDSVYDQAIAA